MKNQLQIFEHQDFGKVRIIELAGEPWFVAKDISKALGYSNSPDALKKHVDAEDKRVLQKSQNATFDIPTRGLAIINESGLYCLIMSSKSPQAKAFKRWVTSEVLPSIRKHGAYATQDTLEKMIGNPQFTEALLDALQEEHAKNITLENEIGALEGKVYTLKDRVGTLKSKVGTLRSKVGTLRSKVGTLESRVDVLQPRAYIGV
jgi:X-X-X-Leu-X-X-Gly heptad repeat protein